VGVCIYFLFFFYSFLFFFYHGCTKSLMFLYILLNDAVSSEHGFGFDLQPLDDV
jgi:hypothetical protein